MKLYTEEQMRVAYNLGFSDAKNCFGRDEGKKENETINFFTPIELPSDEEIGVVALKIADTLEHKLNSQEEAFYLAGFQTCAKWMKEQILNQNKS